MLSVGGFPQQGHPLDVDPFPQGLKLLDLTELKWTDQYNADAAPYEPPTMVQQLYKHP